ncbi:hypothetical protein CDD81_5421 [Ophiocordyceps australis]|uniref:Uncharacterized protein n=1 Tax=Ophiocordyceps australis TaxID=1399860 RepID=A0A2C5YA86_9HYPO|nr:hypothetical protein CDD81_5421 [Ophiocordyceps australis]
MSEVTKMEQIGLWTQDVGSAEHIRDRSLFRCWCWEVASLITATGLAIAIFVVLDSYDGQELPQWPYSINLNTLAAMATLCLRASLVIVAAEIIGQAKWIYFSKGGQQVADFQIFDEASRGLLGSIKLISLLRFGWRGSPIAVAAAFTTVFSLSISPLTQQAIKATPCSRVRGLNHARIPVALEVPGADYYYFDYGETQSYELGAKAKYTMIAGIANPHSNESSIQAKTICPTGNCTFPETLDIPHSTIGLCASCMDMTPMLNISMLDRDDDDKFQPFEATLGDLSVSIQKSNTWLAVGSTNLSFARSILDAEFLDAARQACTNVSVITYSQTPSQHCKGEALSPDCVIAASCSLYPCMKDIKAQVIDGRLEDTVVRTVPARENPLADHRNQTGQGPDHSAIKSPCMIEGHRYDVSNFSLVPFDAQKRTFIKVPIDGKTVDVPSDCVYTMTGVYHYAIQDYIEEELFSGECNDTMKQREHLACGSHWWLHTFYNKANASFDSISTTVQDMATATTNFFRLDGWGPIHDLEVYQQGGDSDMYKTFLQGKVHETTICMRLEWPWLFVPGVLCLTTITLFAAMLISNARKHKQPVWKSSTLPLLLFGLDTHKLEEGSCALDDLQRQAECTTATLDLSGIYPRPALVALDRLGT